MLTAILLAGGFGTRVRAIHPDLPKPMIPVAGEPFLEWIIRYWAGQGVGLVTREESAAEIVASLLTEAEAVVGSLSSLRPSS